MSKVVAMIPARMGSKRIPKKNLRLLGGEPLIAHVTKTAKSADVFDEIYINSEDDVFAEIAEQYGVNFYKRPVEYATDSANNDAFLKDFCEKINADIVVQILPTSPFLTQVEIQQFVERMKQGSHDTFVSVQDHQIACVFDGQGVNFKPDEPHIPSQEMTPVSSYATVLMAWNKVDFLTNMQEHGFGYHGVNGRIGYFPITGFSTVDIDNEEDFRMAEAVFQYLAANKSHSKPEYYQPKQPLFHSEADVPSILKIDGIEHSDFTQENHPLVNIAELISLKNNDVSWCHRLVNTESNSATLISQLPGHGNRLHFHPDWNEWWYIIDGSWIWEIEGVESIVQKGDFVFMPKNKRHKITATGDKPAIRLAVSRADVAHVYPNEGE
jgi:CMP-N-acetylneuraminic acid synthetase/quercetin dioxygenase-like cupin family protein